MNSQVYLHNTNIKVLAISRKQFWIFQDAVQLLLYRASLAGRSPKVDPLDEDEDEDEDEKDEVEEYLHLSKISSHPRVHLSNYKTQQAPSTPNIEAHDFGGLPFDNLLKTPMIDKLVLLDTEEEDNNTFDEDFFFHIAFAEDEVTIMCPTELMDEYFLDAMSICKQFDDVQLIPTEFIVLHVDLSDGYDNLLKVLHVTKPLSTNHIPLYFILTHYGDVVLVPANEKAKVIEILQLKNFEFNNLLDDYNDTGNYPQINSNGNGRDYTNGNGHDIIDETKNDTGALSPTIDLENGTFELFRENGVVPTIRPYSLLLTGSRSGIVSKTIKKFAVALASLGKNLPPYLAITRASSSEVLLLLPKLLRARTLLGFPRKNITGLTSDLIVPVAIDLGQLPLDATGIVAGVALRLLLALRAEGGHPLEMSYFLMATSGLIMVPKEKVKQVTGILDKQLMPEDDVNLL